jgi:hypothetical protein
MPGAGVEHAVHDVPTPLATASQEHHFSCVTARGQLASPHDRDYMGNARKRYEGAHTACVTRRSCGNARGPGSVRE